MTHSGHLVSAVDSVPGLSVEQIKSETAQNMFRWEELAKKLKENKEKLQGTLQQWETVERVADELDAKLDICLSRLQQQQKMGRLDSTTVLQILDKYQTDLMEMTAMQNTFEKLRVSLQQENDGQSITSLKTMKQSFKEKFALAARLANELGAHLDELEVQKNKLGSAIQELIDWLTSIQDKLSNTDEISGSDREVLDRFNTTKAIGKDLEMQKNNVEQLAERTDQLSSSFANSDISSIIKSLVLMRKKFEAVIHKAQKITDTLQHVLHLRIESSIQDFQEWLSSALEKVTWCADLTGDRYSAEAKLDAALEVKDTLRSGDEKLKFAAERLQLLKSALSKGKPEEYYQQQHQNETDWTSLNSQLETAIDKLNKCLHQWKIHQELEEELRKWTTEMEKKIQSFSSLLPSCEAKQERLQLLNVSILR